MHFMTEHLFPCLYKLTALFIPFALSMHKEIGLTGVSPKFDGAQKVNLKSRSKKQYMARQEAQSTCAG